MRRQSLWSKSRRWRRLGLGGALRDVGLSATNSAKPACALPQKGQGAPAREPPLTDEQQREMMRRHYRRQEELKVSKAAPTRTAGSRFLTCACRCFQKLEEANDDSYLDSAWADRQSLRRQFQGLTNIKWGPR